MGHKLVSKIAYPLFIIDQKFPISVCLTDAIEACALLNFLAVYPVRKYFTDAPD